MTTGFYNKKNEIYLDRQIGKKKQNSKNMNCCITIYVFRKYHDIYRIDL